MTGAVNFEVLAGFGRRESVFAAYGAPRPACWKSERAGAGCALGPAQGGAAVRTDTPRLAALLPSPPLEFSRKRALERSYDICWVHSMLPACVHCMRRRGICWRRRAAAAAQTPEPASAPNIFVIQANTHGPRSADRRRPAGPAAEQFEQARARVRTRAKKTVERQCQMVRELCRLLCWLLLCGGACTR